MLQEFAEPVCPESCAGTLFHALDVCGMQTQHRRSLSKLYLKIL